jgi:hypothetical protein
MKYSFVKQGYIMGKFILKSKATSQIFPENINWKEEIKYDTGKKKCRKLSTMKWLSSVLKE